MCPSTGQFKVRTTCGWLVCKCRELSLTTCGASSVERSKQRSHPSKQRSSELNATRKTVVRTLEVWDRGGWNAHLLVVLKPRFRVGELHWPIPAGASISSHVGSQAEDWRRTAIDLQPFSTEQLVVSSSEDLVVQRPAQTVPGPCKVNGFMRL
jgi:hypothetical protein